MTLIVEDGSNVEGANSYASIEEIDTYHGSIGSDTWANEADEERKEQAVIRATTRLNVSYTWTGSKTNGRAQPLTWPRTGVVDCEGDAIAGNEVPSEIKDALSELALIELVSPSLINEDVAEVTQDVSGPVTRIRERLGELETETEYSDSSSSVAVSSNAGLNIDPLSNITNIIRCLGSPIGVDVAGNSSVSPMFGCSSRA